MDNTNEKNREMTAQESLSLITETLNNSRKEITRNSGKFFIFWGILLTIFSLLIYLLCKYTDKEVWNWLWFAMPAVGIPTERFLRGKEGSNRVRNDVSRIVGGVWTTFGFFACAVGAFTLIYTQVSSNIFRLISVVNGLTAELVLLFGLAECITGVELGYQNCRFYNRYRWFGNLLCRRGRLGTIAHFYLCGLGADGNGFDCQNSIQIGYVSETRSPSAF